MSGRLRWAQARWKALRHRRHQEAPRERALKEMTTEFTTQELQEFLEGDLYPTQADPAFKEALRRKLWSLVQERHRGPADQKRGN